MQVSAADIVACFVGAVGYFRACHCSAYYVRSLVVKRQIIINIVVNDPQGTQASIVNLACHS
eukprot:scaffold234134_cov20-Prasinocladus_malaysianus.AAC.1